MLKLGNKLVKIHSVSEDHFNIKLEFADGFVSTVSLQHIFNSPQGLAIELLKGQMFTKCFIESGALAWPNGLEFCADSIRIWIEDQKKIRAS
jgi:hypothetical protein